jgi:putative transposase
VGGTVARQRLPLEFPAMPSGLMRIYGEGHLHFITCSCYRRTQKFRSPQARSTFEAICEEVRQKFDFDVFGYVVMPEHFHILISEPKREDPSMVMQVLKQRVARRLNDAGDDDSFWQRRFYDFNVATQRKKIEKLKYMHRNPVKRGLVERPEDWEWSSFRNYLTGEERVLRVTTS